MTALPPGLTPGTYVIDPSHTELGFSVRHAMISKTRGRFSGVTGTMVFGEDVESAKATAEIDASTIDTREPTRDGHLRSPDFFDVEKYPTLSYTSTGISVTDDGYVLDGDLRIKDVTRPVSLEVEFNGAATDPFGNKKLGFTATTVINRKDYGLTWNAALETGGVLVGDKITITLELEGNLVEGEQADSVQAQDSDAVEAETEQAVADADQYPKLDEDARV